MDGLRLKVRLELSKPEIPLLFRNRFMSLLKSCSCGLYEGRKPRPFSFFLSFDGRLEGSTFKLKKPFATLYMSFLYRELALKVAGFLSEVENFPLDRRVSLRVISVEKQKSESIKSPDVVFKTLSPVIIESKEDKPVLPYCKDFQEEFNRLHEGIFRELGFDYSPVELDFDYWKKAVIKHTLRGFRQSAGKSLMFMTGFLGRFRVRGEPEVLNLLYLKGIGVRTGEGFGFVDIA